MLARNDNNIQDIDAQDANVVAIGDFEAKGVLDLGIGLSVETDTSFWADAACNDNEGTLAHIFFSDELRDIAAAKRICAGCPAMEQCLEGALGRKEPWGVWGGQLFSNGKILLSKRRRGRPPKNPRPEDEFLDVPVPEGLRELAELRTA